VKLIQMRDGRFAGASPGGGEIEDDELAFKFLERGGTIVPDLDELNRGWRAAFLLGGQRATSQSERSHDQT
jgi:hypothetical protein